MEPKLETNLTIKKIYLIIGALEFVVNNSSRPNKHKSSFTLFHINVDGDDLLLFVSCCSFISRSKMQRGKHDYLIYILKSYEVLLIPASNFS